MTRTRPGRASLRETQRAPPINRFFPPLGEAGTHLRGSGFRGDPAPEHRREPSRAREGLSTEDRKMAGKMTYPTGQPASKPGSAKSARSHSGDEGGKRGSPPKSSAGTHPVKLPKSKTSGGIGAGALPSAAQRGRGGSAQSESKNLGEKRPGPPSNNSSPAKSGSSQEGASPPFKKSCATLPAPGYTPLESLEMDTPADPCGESLQPNLPPSKERDDLMWALLKSLPSRDDLEEIISIKLEGHLSRMEKSLKKELKGIRGDIASILERIESIEAHSQKLQAKIESLESSVSGYNALMLDMALRVMDLENRSRRSNIRLRGIPESVKNDDLKGTVTGIFNQYLGKPNDEVIIIDRVHRATFFKAGNNDKPRDVLCKIHYFSVKEQIMREAWSKGPIDFQGTKIMLLQDLSRKTLDLRRVLKPVLEAARQQGAEYKWGYPLHLILRLNGRTFVLRSPRQMPDLCTFLGVQAIEVEDWHKILLSPGQAFGRENFGPR